MSPRDPLSSITLNTPTPVPPAPVPKKLAPIFTLSRSSKRTTPALSVCTSTPGASSSSSSPPPSTPPPISSPLRKRARVHIVSRAAEEVDEEGDVPLPLAGDQDTADEDERRDSGKLGLRGKARHHARVPSVTDWFVPSTPSRGDSKRVLATVADEEPEVSKSSWRRGRRRLGVAGLRIGAQSTRHITPSFTTPSLISTLAHSTIPFCPNTPPSLLLLPSLHPPSGRPRDFSPALSVAFSHVAKYHDASSARSSGARRLVAVAGEEGGIRIVDADEGLGVHREEKGWWWRAHPNAVFDLKWSGDDSRMLTASGDHTVRLHALTSPTPTVLATMKGHTSSIKTSVWFDPSGTISDPSQQGIIASGGRDGNILIYDLRCRGRVESAEGLRRSPREAAGYRAGVPGFSAAAGGSVIDPVMTIKAAHGDGKRNHSLSATRSVTSLVSLSSRPGILASGGSFDGIVKLWDLRFPVPTTRNSDPRPTCTPFASLPDPTVTTAGSKRARSINALAENPSTGDLFALGGDSKIHVLRPSAPLHDTDRSAIQPYTLTHPDLLVSSFYIKMAISPDGDSLACGSGKGGVIAWDLNSRESRKLALGEGGVSWMSRNAEREVSAVDWGKDMVAACADDLATRIWRSNPDVARKLREDPEAAGEWMGCA